MSNISIDILQASLETPRRKVNQRWWRARRHINSDSIPRPPNKANSDWHLWLLPLPVESRIERAPAGIRDLQVTRRDSARVQVQDGEGIQAAISLPEGGRCQGPAIRHGKPAGRTLAVLPECQRPESGQNKAQCWIAEVQVQEK